MAAFISGFQAGSSAYGRGLDIRARREEGALNRDLRREENTLNLALDERKQIGVEAERRLRGRIFEQDLVKKTAEIEAASKKAANDAAAGIMMSDALKTWSSSVVPKTRDNLARIFGGAIEQMANLGPEYAQEGVKFAEGIGNQYQSLDKERVPTTETRPASVKEAETVADWQAIVQDPRTPPAAREDAQRKLNAFESNRTTSTRAASPTSRLMTQLDSKKLDNIFRDLRSANEELSDLSSKSFKSLATDARITKLKTRIENLEEAEQKISDKYDPPAPAAGVPPPVIPAASVLAPAAAAVPKGSWSKGEGGVFIYNIDGGK